MIYFKNNSSLSFHRKPSSFNKYTNREILQYALGANMYIPGIKENICSKLINNDFSEVGSITLCCEDSIKESDLDKAENNIFNFLKELANSKDKMSENYDNLPLIFIRVRNPEHFERMAKLFTEENIRLLAGFVFPKYSSKNGEKYLSILYDLSTKHNEVLYGMPILEDEQLIYEETRIEELKLISKIFDKYRGYILNIRVGGTDFSSKYGLRRGVRNTIYDIRVVSNCLVSILNFFLRESRDYVVSGPVWEYFSYNKSSLEVRGLVKELELDMQNGFFGKTIVHPSQIDIVNSRYIVSYEDYMDALGILGSSGGVIRSENRNRMNEIAPHKAWAKKIMSRAAIFGVSTGNNKDVFS